MSKFFNLNSLPISNDTYSVMIRGKRIALTDEQIELLGLNKRKNPCGSTCVGEVYWRVTDVGTIDSYTYNGDSIDIRLYEVSNYFNDKKFAQQVALHQLLYRKLLKFAYDNEYEDGAEWNMRNRHWTIRYDYDQDMFTVYWSSMCKSQDVHFSSEKGARNAIKEVVEPFMKEHPEFVW